LESESDEEKSEKEEREREMSTGKRDVDRTEKVDSS